MATTMKDIARICGLSAGSVSQVIRNPENPRFTPATRKLILDTAKALDYHQNPLSCALRTNKTKLIGLVLPWNEPEIMDSIEMLVNENGYKLLLQFTASPREGMELEALRSLNDWNVDGILWEPSGEKTAGVLGQLKRMKKEHRPIVLLERGVKGIELPMVRTDYSPALRDCVSHLAEQGYRRVVFVTYDNVDELKNFQRECMEEYCGQNHLEFSILRVSGETRGQREEIAEGLCVADSCHTAYVCLSWLSLVLMEVMESKGFHAPSDYGLVLLQDMLLGGNFRVSTFFRPQLTSIWVDSVSLAQRATQLLLDDIHGGRGAEVMVYCEKAGFSIKASTLRH